MNIRIKFSFFLLPGLIKLLIFSSVYSQQIDSVFLIPQNPTDTDYVKLIAYTTFGTSSCECVYKESFIVNNPSLPEFSIHVQDFHQPGPYMAICNHFDTVFNTYPNYLYPGIYNLTYYCYSIHYNVFIDSVTISFEVTPALAVKNNVSSWPSGIYMTILETENKQTGRYKFTVK